MFVFKKKTDDMRSKGKMASWNDDKGYGFVVPATGGDRVFIHINAFANRSRRPALGQVVTYALSKDKQGRLCAADATLAGDRLAGTEKKKRGSLSLIGAVTFFFILGVLALTASIPPLLFAFYAAASLVTFMFYAADKSAAQKGGWRISENTLHMLSLAGGWPGALIAQQKLRHKSKKQSFRLMFWVTVLLNGGAFVWLLTPAGSAVLRVTIAGIA